MNSCALSLTTINSLISLILTQLGTESAGVLIIGEAGDTMPRKRAATLVLGNGGAERLG